MNNVNKNGNVVNINNRMWLTESKESAHLQHIEFWSPFLRLNEQVKDSNSRYYRMHDSIYAQAKERAAEGMEPITAYRLLVIT